MRLSVFQVVAGNLLPEAVTWFYTSVLKGLQMHGQHEVCNLALTQLAMLVYENLVSLWRNNPTSAISPTSQSVPACVHPSEMKIPY